MIKVNLSEAEVDVSRRALDAYGRSGDGEANRDLRHIDATRGKLAVGRVAFTDKQANVLMDAFNSFDPFDNDEEDLVNRTSERLTGRV